MLGMKNKWWWRLGPALVLAVIILASAQPLTPAQPQPGSDAAIYALIDTVRERAAKIQIDGKVNDWEGIPAFTDPAGDAQGDCSRDLVKTAIAPGENELYILLVTACKPSLDDRTFWFNVDYRGITKKAWTYDYRIGISLHGPHGFRYTEENQPEVRADYSDVAEAAIDDVVEIKVPYTALARHLPPAMAEQLRGDKARSWVRVSPFAYNNRTRQYIDYGATVASYRLIPTPYPLDQPLPRSGTAPLAIELPLNGKWVIWQGAFTSLLDASHHDIWAYDLVSVDQALAPSRVYDSSDGSYSHHNEDYYGWGQPIFTPVVTRVINVHDGTPDNIPPQVPQNAAVCNNVLLDIGANVGLRLCHFRQGSVTVTAGEQIPAGKVVGLTGNSGVSGWAHLHMSFEQLPEARLTLPMALANVRVSLNPAPDDPWTRDLATWEPRVSFFVERLKPMTLK
ncbi:hypothetical protein HYR54_04905 [Candidatus Acetothermia bacterium]|nr:hypothetical protein [Candidatus Acetothermia bacterium]